MLPDNSMEPVKLLGVPLGVFRDRAGGLVEVFLRVDTKVSFNCKGRAWCVGR